jgi:hypothetical protein
MSQAITRELLNLDPEEVDASGEWLFRREEPEKALLRSLERCGQLEPVLVVQEQEGYRLCTGYKRWSGCRSLGIPLLARKVEADPVHRGRLNLQANLPAPLEDAVLVRAARFFQSCHGAGEAAGLEQELADLLHPKRLQVLRAWLGLPRAFDGHLAAGRIPFEAGPVLARCGAGELKALEPLFAELRWSKRRAEELLSWLLEASRRDGVGLEELMERRGMLELSRSDLGPKDRLERLSAEARALRYPELTAIEAEFGAFQREVARSGHWRLEADQSFETDRVLLQARLGSPRDLEQAGEELRRLVESDLMDRLRRWQQQRLNAQGEGKE